MHNHFGSTLRGFLAASALVLTATPAFAGDEERALAAIAQAQGKINAAQRLPTTNPATPELLAKAQSSLRLAQESYKSGKEQAAIKSAVEAQQYADTMIGESQQQSNMDAQAQAQATVDAQAEAGAANARADAAERAAASAAADAQAARNAAALAAATPATTTVTTETVKPAAARSTAPRRKVVRKTTTTAPRTSVAERTTTTVTTHN
ncbi:MULTISPECIES: hypothetical protein [Sphingomonas]|uniref:MASP n=1 Tax=Sphingomonas bisphenolicum TaxID=296544 RepID=A0ABN5WD23_9SPHN|nr:hypothetical protein [Sphingomonas bisphenolicum]MBA4092087.1 hypothetical protein [Sphingobium sp.]BBF68285.1 hypothetical protein SBA_ch1_04850 [Sphingomonas bisphenolicum]